MALNQTTTQTSYWRIIIENFSYEIINNNRKFVNGNTGERMVFRRQTIQRKTNDFIELHSFIAMLWLYNDQPTNVGSESIRKAAMNGSYYFSFFKERQNNEEKNENSILILLNWQVEKRIRIGRIDDVSNEMGNKYTQPYTKRYNHFNLKVSAILDSLFDDECISCVKQSPPSKLYTAKDLWFENSKTFNDQHFKTYTKTIQMGIM